MSVEQVLLHECFADEGGSGTTIQKELGVAPANLAAEFEGTVRGYGQVIDTRLWRVVEVGCARCCVGLNVVLYNCRRCRSQGVVLVLNSDILGKNSCRRLAACIAEGSGGQSIMAFSLAGEAASGTPRPYAQAHGSKGTCLRESAAVWSQA